MLGTEVPLVVRGKKGVAMGLIVFGVVLVVVGLALTFTIIGAIVGIPVMLVGALLAIAGGRRRTVIQVTHHDGLGGADPSRSPQDRTTSSRP